MDSATSTKETTTIRKKMNMGTIDIPNMRIVALRLTMVLALLLVLSNLGWGQTNTWDGSSDANWNTNANWSLNHVPLLAEDVVIPNLSVEIIVNTAAQCNTIVINSGSSTTTLRINSPYSLTVTNSITINAPTGTTGTNRKRVSLYGGTLTCASIIMATTTSDYNQVYLRMANSATNGSGTPSMANVTGNITMNSTSIVRNFIPFIDANAGTLNIGGNITGGGITAENQNSSPTYTVNFNGSSAGQTIPVNGTNYTYYNLTINNTNSSGTTLQAALGTTTLLNNITVGDGTNTSRFNTGSFDLTFGNSKILTVAANSIMNAANTSVAFGTGGTATINGMFQTANTAGFSGGTGTAIRSTNSPTISLGSNSTIEYTLAGDQAVTGRAYYNLIFSGSGVKSIVAGTSVGGKLSIAPTGSAKASVGAGLNINVGSLTLGSENIIYGTWGSTSATSADNHRDDYFAPTTGYVTVTDARPVPSFSNLTASQSICHGISAVTLFGTVSAAGPIYPANGELVGLNINGVAQNATIAGGAGAFTVNFNTSAIPANSTPYAITYTYAGGTNLGAAPDNTSTTLTVNASPIASVTAQTNITCYAAKDGTIEVTVTYATTAPYLFSVNGGADGTWQAATTGDDKSLFTGLLPNVAYRIKVKDHNGCESK
jgi:hypothetical protein